LFTDLAERPSPSFPALVLQRAPARVHSVRRLHDTNRTGWWLLVGLIPILGVFVLLIFAVQDSQPGDNQYGPNPKVLPTSVVPG
jgi:uncharacterized membrane protein YhaH (DUF805 family)